MRLLSKLLVFTDGAPGQYACRQCAHGSALFWKETGSDLEHLICETGKPMITAFSCLGLLLLIVAYCCLLLFTVVYCYTQAVSKGVGMVMAKIANTASGEQLPTRHT